MASEVKQVVRRNTLVVDGLTTSYLEAGEGEPVVLLHGGEFGANAELGWEHTIPALAARYRVLAPDMLGFGKSAKVVDLLDGRGMRIRHIARFCALLGIESASFVGNSMGAVMLLTDATSDVPTLPARKLALLCGGGNIQQNAAANALYDYDATLPAMRRIVEALFHHQAFADDEAYVRRRFESSLVPGAWEALAVARFRRPGESAPAPTRSERKYEQVKLPSLLIEGEHDKLLPAGWASDIACRMPAGSSAVVEGAGHCPQIESADATNSLLLDFLATETAHLS